MLLRVYHASMRPLFLFAALLSCSAVPPPMATSTECSLAGWPVWVWRGNVSYRCPPDPMDPDQGHESDFLRRGRDAGSPSALH